MFWQLNLCIFEYKSFALFNAHYIFNYFLGCIFIPMPPVHCRSKRTVCQVVLTATRTTRYQPLSAGDNFLDLLYEPREPALFSDFNADFKPQYGDVDVVGLIVHISGVSHFERPRWVSCLDHPNYQ